MRNTTLSYAGIVLALSFSLAAQSHPPSGGTNRPPTTSTGRTPPPGVSSIPGLGGTLAPRSFFISGKVVVDDGTLLTEGATIQSICQGRRRSEAYTDSKGNFSFELGKQRYMMGSEVDDDAQTSAGMLRTPQRGGSRQDLQDCELQATLPGFISEVVELTSKLNDIGNADVGRIVLHRLAQVQGFTISATSAMAPDKARKNYEKGRMLEKKEKWPAAQESLERAVEVYPHYAAAWLELGRVQERQGNTEGARRSFKQALAADAKFVSPHEELARLALRDKQWQELADETGELLKLNPLSFPQAWFYNSVANYYLQKYDVAEKSACRGLDLDVEHRIPKLEYLLAMVLVGKHDYRGAAEHMRTYVRLSPNTPDALTAQKQITELEKLSGAGDAGKAPDNK